VASQNTNRKLADIAVEVGDTGSLDLPGQSTGNRGRIAAPTALRRVGVGGTTSPDGSR
jgi:hypothetical protein